MMLRMIHLLAADPFLSEDAREAVASSPEAGKRALLDLGLNECEASILVGLPEPRRCNDRPAT